jgi:hypothetical protein
MKLADTSWPRVFFRERPFLFFRGAPGRGVGRPPICSGQTGIRLYSAERFLNFAGLGTLLPWYLHGTPRKHNENRAFSFSFTIDYLLECLL